LESFKDSRIKLIGIASFLLSMLGDNVDDHVAFTDFHDRLKTS